jgi:hypothetical protein
VVDLDDRVLGAATGRTRSCTGESPPRRSARAPASGWPGPPDPARSRSPAGAACCCRAWDQPLRHGPGPKAAVLQAGPQLGEEGLLAPHVSTSSAVSPSTPPSGPLVAPHPTPPNQQKRPITDEVEQITKPTGPILGRPSGQLGLDPQYPRLRLLDGERRPRRAGMHRRPPSLPATSLRTRCRPSPCTRLSRARTTTAAPPAPRPTAVGEPARHRPGRTAGRRPQKRSHVPHLPVDGAVPSFPRQPRHTTAADLQRGLPAGPPHRRRSRIAQPQACVHCCPAHIHQVGAGSGLTGVDHWFSSASTFPSRLPDPGRWQCRPVPSCQAAPTLPAPPGSGCPQLQRPAATGRRRSPFPSARTHGASWRTRLLQ